MSGVPYVHSLVNAIVSSLTPGPMVLEMVALLRYRPLQEAGLAFTTDSKMADAFSYTY